MPGAVRRIQIMGSSGSGKTTLAARLASHLDVPHVELDALSWLPGWTERDINEFRALVDAATDRDGWVVDGNYTTHLGDLLRERTEMVVWLDLPLSQMVARQLRRSWRRWRAREVLWDTNVERFWPHLAIWDPRRSLVAYSLSTHRRRRSQTLAMMHDPRLAHVRFVRLTSQREVDRFLASMLSAAGEVA